MTAEIPNIHFSVGMAFYALQKNMIASDLKCIKLPCYAIVKYDL